MEQPPTPRPDIPMQVQETPLGFTITTEGGRISGIFRVINGQLAAQVEDLVVSDEKRGAGIGSELVRAFSRTAIAYGAHTLRSVPNSSAFRNRRRIFGDDKLKYVQDNQPADMTADEAADYISQFDHFWDEGSPDFGPTLTEADPSELYVDVDLDDPQVRERIGAPPASHATADPGLAATPEARGVSTEGDLSIEGLKQVIGNVMKQCEEVAQRDLGGALTALDNAIKRLRPVFEGAGGEAQAVLARLQEAFDTLQSTQAQVFGAQENLQDYNDGL